MTLLESLRQWLPTAADVRVATVFGSHARALCGEAEPADPWSDVDLQLVTSRPEIYDTRDWTRNIPGQQLYAYAVRPVFGGAKKITALFSGGEADFVIVAHWRLRLGRILFGLGVHRRSAAVERGLADFTLVMSFGHKVLKGGPGWERFYARAIREVPRKQISDQEAISLADGAYVDAVSIMSKLARGELVAAQRWLHRSVIETNLRLMYELRVRRAQASYPDGRRVEQLLPPHELAEVRFEAGLNADSLRTTTLAAIAATRRLIRELAGYAPVWPEIR